ncbi:right-handed parallel beta-helix repeat-containing protein [Pedobacter sp. MC2016-14]|uniref:right-handed parallel beta-helix repeat-containing protein n=1 Tax=Pedobacter sp. MC2016-14 TaxID=2897327 RepID=UPI001E418A23|nr:right-handed parallel beta-helix repeat-containing protein [Pedobacter sp. MC2016-14]MCD0486675.1 right-handed parallel beta-helix repeat-containing protein [Pedobacter sp. MC2016-14]
MKNLFKLSLSLAVVFCSTFYAANAQSVTKIYVDPKGSETANGSKNNPVNSLTKAVALAKGSGKQSSAPIEIILRGGTYFLNQTFEITAKTGWDSKVPLTLTGYKKEKAILHGGKIAGKELILPVSDPEFAQRFSPEVRSKIRQINLDQAGITNIGKMHTFGFSRPISPAWLEIFIDGHPGTIARWPNKGSIPIKSVLDTGSVPRWGDLSNRGGVFTYADSVSRPSKWKHPEKAWISGYFMWGYADDAVQLKAIDTVKKVISSKYPSYYGFSSGKGWRSWYVYNLPEEIDLPGEYYVEESTRTLYFLPPDNFDKVEISEMETPLLALDDVSNVTVKNLFFQCGRGMGISTERTTKLMIESCSFSNLGLMAIYMGKGVKPIDPMSNVGGIPTSRTVGNIVQYVYDNSNFDREAGTNNGIVNCEIFNTGCGGIYLNGGNRLTLEAGNNYVENCRVHDYNRLEKTYRPGIWITGCGNHISNCEVYNAPSVGIFLHGNNHLIEYNNLHHLNLEGDDMGALYFGRNPSEQGQIVRYNYFSHIGSEHKTMAIYHDDGACGMQVYSNIFYKAGTVAGFIGGGRDNPYTNNIIIDNRYAFHMDNRLSNWARGVMAPNGLFRTRLELVNYNKPPYSVQYPALANYWEDDPGMPKRNFFSKNLLVNNKERVEGKPELTQYADDNFETTTDPGFVNYAKEDFRLKKDAIVWEKIPGFKAIPVEKIGYKRNYKKK